MLNKILLLLLAITLSACQHSPRKEYFALSASAANSSINTQAPVNLVVGIGPVTIPEYLQHNKISYWKTAQQLILQDNHYWAEPLERGITRVLALELQAAHTDWRVVQFPWPANQRPAISLRIDIQRLDAFVSYTVLEATIDWINVQNKAVLGSQRISLRQDSSANSAAIAQTFSELLQQTARTITLPPRPTGS